MTRHSLRKEGRATAVRKPGLDSARRGDELTEKRLERQGKLVHLLPANLEFAPIVVDTKVSNNLCC